MLSRRCLITAVALGMALILSDAQLAQARRLRPAEAQTASLTKSLGDHAADPSCCAPKPVCCPEPCITYRSCGPKLCCGNCNPPKPIVLKVKDPCTGCETDVKVCLPACCEGEPTVCKGQGFLCRDTVEYEWCCGFYVRVAFKKCGDLVVTTWGR